MVEDANLECCSLWDCLPPAGTGRVILTSIADLRGQAPHGGGLAASAVAPLGGGLAASAVAPLGIAATVELAPLTTADSLDMWRQMKLFALTVPQVDMTISESDLEAQCVAATPPVVFVPPPTTEKSKAKKQRHRDLQMALREHRELSTPGLAEFLEEQLGNLPLTVALCGQMLRADDRLESVADLIALFPQLEQREVDEHGRNRITDQHLLGLDVSIRVAIGRIKNNPTLSEEEKAAAMALLVMLSLLPGTKTPVELFSKPFRTQPSEAELAEINRLVENINGHPLSTKLLPMSCYEDDFDPMTLDKAIFVSSMLPLRQCLNAFPHLGLGGLFGTDSGDVSVEALGILQQYGLVKRGPVGSQHVGAIHQLLQKCVRDRINREEHMEEGIRDADAVVCLRRVLREQFEHDRNCADTANLAWVRLLEPCVVHLWATLKSPDGKERALQRTRADSDLIVRYGTRRCDDGDPQSAVSVQEEALAFDRKVMKPDDPDIATAMSILANTYSALGRYDDELKLLEETLAFRQRVLPAGHRDITVSMSDLAHTYSDKGRRTEALELYQKVLKLQEQTLPSDDPNIVRTKHNLATGYYDLGQYDSALLLQEQVLASEKERLPPNHPIVLSSMCNLASYYSALGRTEDAVTIRQETLALRKQVLPPGHPDAATSMNNLAAAYSQLGQFAKALALNQEALEFHKREQAAEHPVIASCMCNLAQTYSHLGRHEDALAMLEEAISFQNRVEPDNRPSILKTMSILVTVHFSLEQFTKAEKIGQEVLTHNCRCFTHNCRYSQKITPTCSNRSVTWLKHGAPLVVTRLRSS